MKKIILLLSCIFVMTSMFAQTSFQELTLEKALEQVKHEMKTLNEKVEDYGNH